MCNNKNKNNNRKEKKNNINNEIRFPDGGVDHLGITLML
jgi:hypothetical protein